MKKQMIAIILVLFIWLPSCSGEKAESRNERNANDAVFIHITHGSDDIHRLLMGLQMANIMSESRKVLVYFDIQGIEAVLKETKDLNFSHFPGSQSQLQILLARGVPLLACPGCLKASGHTPQDLLEGVEIANKDKFFSFASARILTLDN